MKSKLFRFLIAISIIAIPWLAHAQARLFADEAKDFGVTPQDTLQSKVSSPTPLTNPAGKTITTEELKRYMGLHDGYILIDVLQGSTASIPGSRRFSSAGDGGTLDDFDQKQVESGLNILTSNQKDKTLIFYCAHSQCWESYNALLRARAAGFTRLLWYRGGISAWLAAGLPTSTR